MVHLHFHQILLDFPYTNHNKLGILLFVLILCLKVLKALASSAFNVLSSLSLLLVSVMELSKLVNNSNIKFWCTQIGLITSNQNLPNLSNSPKTILQLLLYLLEFIISIEDFISSNNLSLADLTTLRHSSSLSLSESSPPAPFKNDFFKNMLGQMVDHLHHQN